MNFNAIWKNDRNSRQHSMMLLLCSKHSKWTTQYRFNVQSAMCILHSVSVCAVHVITKFCITFYLIQIRLVNGHKFKSYADTCYISSLFGLIVSLSAFLTDKGRKTNIFFACWCDYSWFIKAVDSICFCENHCDTTQSTWH